MYPIICWKSNAATCLNSCWGREISIGTTTRVGASAAIKQDLDSGLQNRKVPPCLMALFCLKRLSEGSSSAFRGDTTAGVVQLTFVTWLKCETRTSHQATSMLKSCDFYLSWQPVSVFKWFLRLGCPLTRHYQFSVYVSHSYQLFLLRLHVKHFWTATMMTYFTCFSYFYFFPPKVDRKEQNESSGCYTAKNKLTDLQPSESRSTTFLTAVYTVERQCGVNCHHFHYADPCHLFTFHMFFFFWDSLLDRLGYWYLGLFWEQLLRIIQNKTDCTC